MDESKRVYPSPASSRTSPALKRWAGASEGVAAADEGGEVFALPPVPESEQQQLAEAHRERQREIDVLHPEARCEVVGSM